MCQPVFARFIKSRYAETFLMTSNLTQLDVLKCEMELDQCDDVFYNPDHRVILPDNPLNMDVWLVGIQNGIVILLATQLYRLLCFCNGTHSGY